MTLRELQTAYLRYIDAKRATIPPEDERIYFDIAYVKKDTAKYYGCIWDTQKKLWYTHLENPDFHQLMERFEIHPETSETILYKLEKMTQPYQKQWAQLIQPPTSQQ